MKLKLSQYTLVVSDEPTTYLFNTLTGSLLPLTADEWQKVRHLFEAPLELKTNNNESRSVAGLLFEHGFLVPHDKDELAAALQKYDQGRSNKQSMSLTIATTMKCNMKCHYCYEDRSSTETLSKHDIDAIVNFVSERLAENGNLYVNWFGGEPLLEKEFIIDTSRALMALAHSRQAGYIASMVSNGYYLDPATAKELRDHQVKSVQITLDGVQAQHDAVRKHLAEPGEPRIGSYEKIVENIALTADIISIDLRINVSQQNAATIEKLIDDLANAGLASKIHSIYFSPLFNYKVNSAKESYVPISTIHMTTRSFAQLEAKLLTYAARRGFRLKNWANANYSGCIAVTHNSFAIDSNGSVVKCDHEFGASEHAIASLRNPEISNSTREKMWLEYRPESNPGCDSCPLFPVCYSNCPHKNLLSSPQTQDKCPSHKYNWETTLPLILSQRIKLNSNPEQTPSTVEGNTNR